MRIDHVIVKSVGFLWLFSVTPTAQTWTLPQRMAVKDTGRGR